MKSKFIGIILAIAVVLSMVMVPAMSGVTLAQGNSGVEVVPNLTSVGFTQNFNLAIWGRVPPAQAWDTGDVHLNFNTIYMQVNSIANGALPTVLGSTFSNALGTIDFTAGILGGNVTGDRLICTVNCTSTSATGISTIDFVNIGPLRVTDIINAGNSLINWGLVINGTLRVGSPALTVDVSPDGKGTVKANGVLLTGDPNTTNWAWDANVTLLAVNSTPGWAFKNWTGDASGTNPSTIVTMTDAKSVIANFAELPCDLDVTPNTLDLAARSGNNADNDTVTIANLGGGTCCWALGYTPSWSVGDTWSYWNTYDTFIVNGTPVPYPNPYWNPAVPCAVNDTVLNLTVVSETNCTYTAFADWPITDPQRTANTSLGKIPVCLQNATVVVNKCTLDYVQQLANLTLYLPGPMPGQALVTWSYNGCHGWPYYAGKTWTYTMTVTDATGTTVHNAQAMVTAGPIAFGGFTDVYVITHATPVWGGQIFMQQYWSDTARNFVYQWDGGTFNAPPLDVRMLQGFAIAGLPPPACCNNIPSWLSFNKRAGSLGIGGSELLTVTANATGLAVGMHNASFCISCCCCCCPGMPKCLNACPQYECVNVNFEVQPATTIDVIRNLPDDALVLNAEYPGDSFWVYVNFTAPVDQFNSIGLTDLAPAGWDVETNILWCSPVASWTMSPGNKAEYSWSGEATGYASGTPFSAKYKVTIPNTAQNGLNNWPLNDGTKAWAEYWFGAKGPYSSAVTGEWQKIVTVPGKVVGETCDVNANGLPTTLVVLLRAPGVVEDSDSSTCCGSDVPSHPIYENMAGNTGMYWQVASKYCYFTLNTSAMPITRNPSYPDNMNLSTTALLYAGYTIDFEGDYGLVPKACTMSYAMTSVNHWLFVPIDGSLVPHPDWQLSLWKAMDSVHSWQFPTGCNT